MNETRQSSGEEHQAGCVWSPEGLPPLPRSLSAVLTCSGGSWRDMGKVQSEADLSPAGASGDASPGGLCKHVGLDGALALLRKEMVGHVMFLSFIKQTCFCAGLNVCSCNV